MRYFEIMGEARKPATGFQLHPGLDPNNYQITGSFGQAGSWQAMSYVGDSRMPRGQMAKVGYVWISKAANTIVPISRGDEHHEGYDMIYEVLNNKLQVPITRKEYVAVWPFGTNYVYSRKDLADWKVALEKYLAWGGKDGVLEGANELNGLATSYSHLVGSGDMAPAETGKLAPLGQKFYDLYKGLQDAILKARGTDVRSAQAAPFRAALALAQYIEATAGKLGFADFEWDDLRALPKTIRALAKEGDLEALTELFFGFNSFKRKVHEGLRHLDTYNTRHATAYFGDLKLAENLLAHL